jgi:hypothetical protein
MKRVGLWAVGIGVLVSVGLLSVGQGHADDNDGATKCSLKTLKGRYLFATTGTALPPAFGLQEGDPPLLISVAGYQIFDGKGKGQDFVTVLFNGIKQDLPVPILTTYTLNSDCTGTYTEGGDVTFDIFVSPNGDELASIATSQGFVLVNAPNRRVAPK